MAETARGLAIRPETIPESSILPVERWSLRNIQKYCRSLLIGVVLGVLPAAHADDRSETIPSASVTKGKGSLVLVGGGKNSQEIVDHFLMLAGAEKARILYIPSASRDEDIEDIATYWEAQKGPLSIRKLHTRSHEEANDPDFIRPLQEATGVWFSGGNQSRIAEVYCGTRVQLELQKLLARGGVIGGTSAGASALGRKMILDDTSPHLVEGLDLLPRWVVESHFTRSGRDERFMEHLNRESNSELFGLGIDEETAVCVQGPNVTVFGKGNVSFYPTSSAQREVQVLKSGQKIDLESDGIDIAVTR